jgi:uncharacterized membrane protein YccF (DUF307 family)
VRTLINLLWFIFSGLWMAIGYAVAGLICCVLVVTIPWGIACFRIAGYALWPFGRTLVRRPGAGLPSGAGNLVWFVFAGWWIALGHVLLGIALCVTIIGIPFGLAHFKLIGVSLTPLGREVVPSGTAYPSYRW